MLSTINTPDETTPTSRDEMPGLTPGPGQVLIEVEAFSLNRGELALLAARQHGWQPGQDIAGRAPRQPHRAWTSARASSAWSRAAAGLSR